MIFPVIIFGEVSIDGKPEHLCNMYIYVYVDMYI